jgi:hypothetical protein
MEQGGCQLPSLPLARIGKRRDYRLETGSSSFSSSTSFFSPALWRQHLFQLVVATSRDRYAESVALAQPSCLFVRHRFFVRDLGIADNDFGEFYTWMDWTMRSFPSRVLPASRSTSRYRCTGSPAAVARPLRAVRDMRPRQQSLRCRQYHSR